jgi:SAM-dependent methyltransferase
MAAKTEKRQRYWNINRFILGRSIREFAERLPEGALVHDIGAGSGHYRHIFEGKRYIAVDRGLERKGYKGLDVVSDVRFLPFRDSSVGYGLCVEVLEHIYEGEVFLEELRRVLKKGGEVLLTVPLCMGEHMMPFDFFRYTSSGIERAVSDSGLKLRKIETRGGYFIFLAYHLKRFPEYLTSSDKMPDWARQSIQRMLYPVFAYAIPFFLQRLDKLDRIKNTTIGYVCLIEKDRD